MYIFVVEGMLIQPDDKERCLVCVLFSFKHHTHLYFTGHMKFLLTTCAHSLSSEMGNAVLDQRPKIFTFCRLSF